MMNDAATDVELGQDDDELRKANAAEQLPNGPIAPSLITRNPAGGCRSLSALWGCPTMGSGHQCWGLWVFITRLTCLGRSLHSMAQRSRLREFEYPIWKPLHTSIPNKFLEAQKQIHYYDARIKELDRLQDFEKRLADLEAAKRSLTSPRNMNRGPASPRSPRSSIADSRDDRRGS